MENPESPARPLLLLLVPMLATFAIQRTVLHHSHPDTHVYIHGAVVHHLFWGLLVLIPVAFLLAFGIRNPRMKDLARVLLGFSSAMVLDEIIYLVFTDGSGVSYRGDVSLRGAAVFIGLAAAFLVGVYAFARRRRA